MPIGNRAEGRQGGHEILPFSQILSNGNLFVKGTHGGFAPFYFYTLTKQTSLLNDDDGAEGIRGPLHSKITC